MPLKRISFLPKLFMGGLLIGLTTGSLSSSFYYQKQLTKERQNFLECQLAWEKYYSLAKENKPIQLNLAKQLEKKVKLDLITQKLKGYGLEINHEDLAWLINESGNQFLVIIKGKIQELFPWVGYLEKYKESNHLAKERESQKVYYSEILPKCQKIKDWEKYMNKLTKE